MNPTDEDVRNLQKLLQKQGHSPGPIDGSWGPLTSAALYRALEAPVPVEEEEGVSEGEMDENTKQLIRELRSDEGFVKHAYKDSLGYWTIGIGRLIDKKRGGGITEEEAFQLKLNDISRIQSELDRRMSWWRGLDPVRQRAVQNMAFQMGVGELAKATNTFGSIRAGHWKAAADKLRRWAWAKQTPNRANRVIRMIETGRA